MEKSGIELSCEHCAPVELHRNAVVNMEGMKMQRNQSISKARRFKRSCQTLNGFSGFTYIARISNVYR